MLDKIKALPHKITFAIGLTLQLVVLAISSILSFSIWSILIEGIIMGTGILFIVIASDKRHSNSDK